MNDIAISVQNVSKSFKLPHEKYTGLKQAVINFRPGKKYEMQHVLQNISFDIKKGDFFGIVGRNGSGKSTLLKTLAQIYTPDKGGVALNGSLTPFIELGVGFNPELTGRENVYLNGALLGFDRKQMDGMYRDIVDFAELHEFMDQKLKNYSSGMQVRLAFSIAIRAQSDILLLDEVLAVGDAGFQQKCFNYFEELREQKKTVVFVSHDMGAVTRFCNKAVYIDKGKLTHQGTPAEIADIYTIGNIREANREAAGGELSKAHSVNAKVTKVANDHVVLEVSYKSKDKDELHIGISVQKEGVSVAEITTEESLTLRGSGKLTYTLDTTMFNSGLYQVGVGLFRRKNRELLSVVGDKVQFVVKGNDPTKGAALKLENTWKQES